MKKILFYLFLVSFLAASNPQPVNAAQNVMPEITPSAVIAAINAYREQNGLHPLAIDPTLMSLAQGHSDYQASIGIVTHEGPGGSRPKDRAYAAGYGGGNFIFLSEIIYGGYDTDYNSAIEWWKNSPVHNTEMLRDNIDEIGAGVSTDGNWTYFTAELGRVATWSAPADVLAGTSTDGEEDTSPPVVIAVPVVIATPREDGSIVHIIRTGQAMWTIAAVYDVDLEELLALNGMDKTSIVKPGDEILVVPANQSKAQPTNTPFSSPLPTKNPTQQANSTDLPAATSVSSVSTPPSSTNQEPVIGEAISSQETISPNVKRIIVGAFVILLLVIVGSLFIQKQEPPPPPKEDVVR